MIKNSSDVIKIEKEATNVMLNIFKNIAKFKGIKINELNSFDDVTEPLVVALKDLSMSATDDIRNDFANGIGLKTIEDLTSEFSAAYLNNLINKCKQADLKHEYFVYLAGIAIIKEYI